MKPDGHRGAGDRQPLKRGDPIWEGSTAKVVFRGSQWKCRKEDYVKEVWVIPLGFATQVGQAGKRRRGEIKHDSSVSRLGETRGAMQQKKKARKLCSGEKNGFSLSRRDKHQGWKASGQT